jgi:hypothetical protein
LEVVKALMERGFVSLSLSLSPVYTPSYTLAFPIFCDELHFPLISSLGADPLKPNKEGMNGLHLCALIGTLPLLKHLIQVLPPTATSIPTNKHLLPIHYLCSRTFPDLDKDREKRDLLLFCLDKLIRFHSDAEIADPSIRSSKLLVIRKRERERRRKNVGEID